MSASSTFKLFFSYKIVPADAANAIHLDRDTKKSTPRQYIDMDSEETPEWDLPDTSQGQLMDISVALRTPIDRRRTKTSSTPPRFRKSVRRRSHRAKTTPSTAPNPPNRSNRSNRSSHTRNPRSLRASPSAWRATPLCRTRRAFSTGLAAPRRRKAPYSRTIWNPICVARPFAATSSSSSPSPSPPPSRPLRVPAGRPTSTPRLPRGIRLWRWVRTRSGCTATAGFAPRWTACCCFGSARAGRSARRSSRRAAWAMRN